MSDEIKYCKFCNKEKPIKEFVKSGFAIKNICRECQNKKQAQIYRDSKKVKELEKENQELKKQLEEHNLAIENLAYWKGKNESKMKINRLRRENQELKKQLEVGKEQYNDLVEEKEKIQEQLSSNTLQFENQQKEFIGYLEKEIVDSRAGSSQYYSAIEHLKLYNKIIGGDK